MSLFHFSLRRASAFALLCLATALLTAGCQLPWQHSALSGTKPTAQQLLAAVRKSFGSVSAFHVVMRVQNAGPATSSRFQIRNADGDIVMPDKIKAQATIILSGQAVTVNLISIGTTQFITDPITGQWRVVKGALDPRTLASGIISVVSDLHNVSAPTDDTVNGTPCWRITGKLAASDLSFITGGGVPLGTMLQTSECIGKNNGLLSQVVVTGQAAVGYTAQTTLTFLLSNYNEHVNITAPLV